MVVVAAHALGVMLIIVNVVGHIDHDSLSLLAQHYGVTMSKTVNCIFMMK